MTGPSKKGRTKPIWSMDMIAKANGAGERVHRRGRTRSGAGPDPVDVHVGSRLRERRLTQGISQTTLGDALGLTFQQVQKYERGANRISASMLWRAAQALGVPVSYFFDGIDGGSIATVPEGEDGRSVLVLTRAINRLDPTVRDRLAQLVTAMANSQGDGAVEEDAIA